MDTVEFICSCPACMSGQGHFSADAVGDTYSDQAGAAGKPVFSAAQVARQLTTQWGGASETTTRDWKAGTLTYSLPNTAPAGSEAAGFKVMTATMKATARDAFALWDDLVAVKLVEVSSPAANISFAYSSATQGGGTYTALSGTVQRDGNVALTSAKVWLNSTWSTHDSDSDLYDGGYGVMTYIHEIGHALGLSHPGTYDASSGQTLSYAGSAEYAQDTQQYSLMSYWRANAANSSVDHVGADNRWHYASTPLLDDILAIQSKYGADMTTRTGDTVYGFHSTADRDVYDFDHNPDPVIAIWDAGGHDTLDASGYSTDQLINLNPGTFSSIGHLTDNVAIAYNCWIESAVGGSGSDLILGNALGNTLLGGEGNDAIDGGAGNDLIFGDAGDDRLAGGSGNDEVHGGSGNDVIFGGTGGDSLFGEDGDDFIGGGDGDDYISGGAGNDALYGEAGFDYIFGDSGDDRIYGGRDDGQLYGGSGNDVIFGEDGNDGIFGEDGNDFIGAGSGNDLVVGGAGNDEIHGEDGDDQIFGDSGNDVLYGEDGNDVIRGGDGNDRIDGGPGDDILVGEGGNDTFVFRPGFGHDAIEDFQAGWGKDDVIELSNAYSGSFAEVMSHAAQIGGDVVFSFGSDVLTLKHTNIQDLNQNDFTFV